MKKGFTLIEMIAVIGIMGLITVIILPNLVNQVNRKQEDISAANKKIIYAAADLYMSDNDIKGEMCITIKKLVDKGYLETPLKDLETGKNISLDTYISVKYNSYNEAEYDLVKKCN